MIKKLTINYLTNKNVTEGYSVNNSYGVIYIINILGFQNRIISYLYTIPELYE